MLGYVSFAYPVDRRVSDLFLFLVLRLQLRRSLPYSVSSISAVFSARTVTNLFRYLSSPRAYLTPLKRGRRGSH